MQRHPFRQAGMGFLPTPINAGAAKVPDRRAEYRIAAAALHHKIHPDFFRDSFLRQNDMKGGVQDLPFPFF